MGRWRPPRPAASPYITAQGFRDLESELKMLWKRRAEVVQALAAAAAEGDRSENAEYIYRKKELGGIDYRIRYLQKRLPQLKVVQGRPDSEQVFFGARVLLERDDGREFRYTIVGADEADAGRHRISIDSPMAQALLKSRVDDEIKLDLGERSERFVVLEIRYQ